MKAYNIQKRGGKGMLLVYNSNEIDDNDYNVDDPIGEKVEIPSMIIPKDIGNISFKMKFEILLSSLYNIFFAAIVAP